MAKPYNWPPQPHRSLEPEPLTNAAPPADIEDASLSLGEETVDGGDDLVPDDSLVIVDDGS